MFFHVFRHVEAYHRLLVVKEKFSQCPRQFRFPHASRAQEDERPDRSLRIGKPRAAPSNRVSYSRERFVLPNHALAQPLFHVHQFVHLGLEQLADWNSCPLCHDLRHFLLAHFFLEHRRIPLQFCEALLRFFQLTFFRAQLSIADFRHALQIPGTFLAQLFSFQFVDLFLDLAQLAIASFSSTHLALSALDLSFSSASSFSASRRRSFECGSFSLLSACLSISSCRMRLRISSISVGMESICIRRLAAPSSIRSMALSGRKRSEIYRCERVTAATSAAS